MWVTFSGLVLPGFLTKLTFLPLWANFSSIIDQRSHTHTHTSSSEKWNCSTHLLKLISNPTTSILYSQPQLCIPVHKIQALYPHSWCFFHHFFEILNDANHSSKNGILRESESGGLLFKLFWLHRSSENPINASPETMSTLMCLSAEQPVCCYSLAGIIRYRGIVLW